MDTEFSAISIPVNHEMWRSGGIYSLLLKVELKFCYAGLVFTFSFLITIHLAQ
jgi:hypothetical protein